MWNKLAVAGAMLATVITSGSVWATGAPTRAEGAWAVLQDAGGTACYVANRAPIFDEAQLSGFFATEQAAETALATIASCDPVNIEHDKDSVETSG